MNHNKPFKAKRDRDGVQASIWDSYNPKLYLLKLVEWEDNKRYQGVDLYQRKLIPDTDKFTKKVWRIRFKNLIAKILI